MSRSRSYPTPFRRSHLSIERLESRDLLDAALAPVADRLLVQYRDAEPASVAVVAVPDGKSLDDALADFRADPNVAFAEPDLPLFASVIPNDPSFGSLYGLNNTGQSGGTPDADIDAPEAWDVTTGSMKNVVAVIDSGVRYDHPDLYLNIWINQGEIPADRRANLTDLDGDGLITFRDLNNPINQGTGKISDVNGNGRIDGADLLAPYSSSGTGGWADGFDGPISNGYIDDFVGWDFVNNDNNPLDDNGHGTHVAGTIGATGNNGVGVTGVNWSVQIMALKFLGSGGSGSTSGAVSAVNYAVANGAHVSNNSWGGGGFSQSLFNAIAAGRATNHVFVAAAGNNGGTSANYPALYNLDNIISVAATTRTDALASYSNRSATSVDLGAPGSSILSTYGSSYATLSGTSMATPHVSGVVALVRTLKPTWTYSQLISQVLNTGDPLSSLSGVTVTGRRLNAFKAVSNLAPVIDVTGPRVTSAVPNSTTSLSSIRVTFNEAINPATFDAADLSLSGPGGPIVVNSITAVTGSNNTQFNIGFTAQTAPGTYTLRLGPDVLDTTGNAMDQNQDGTNGDPATDVYSASFTVSAVSTFSSTTPVNLPDLTTVTSSITVPSGLTVGDLEVRVNITHTWDSDLTIRLRGPDGTTVVLFNRRGGSGDNLTNTVFSDEASVAIGAGVAPFAGTYRPEGLLSAFDGKSAGGTWQLLITDSASLDTGQLNSWSITIAAAASGLSEGGEGGGDAGGAEASGTSTSEGTTGVSGASAVQGPGEPSVPTTDASGIVRLLDVSTVETVIGSVAGSEVAEEEAVSEVRRSVAAARRTAEDVFAGGRFRSRRSASLDELLAGLGGMS